MPKFNEELFNAGISAMLSQHRPNEEMTDDLFVAYKEAFGESTPQVKDVLNTVDAINAFEQWLIDEDWHYEPPVLYTGKLLTVTLTAQAASGTISIAMDFEPADWNDTAPAIAAAKNDLQRSFLSAFPAFSKPVKPVSSPNGKPTSNAPETETFEFDRLVIGSYNGKPTARLMPTEGRWTQFGVPLYPTEAKKIGIELPEEEGEYDYTGTMTYALKSDGKPMKVLSADLDES